MPVAAEARQKQISEIEASLNDSLEKTKKN
jgi:hypothetical protein